MKKVVCLMVLVIAVSSLALGGCKKKESKPGAGLLLPGSFFVRSQFR